MYLEFLQNYAKANPLIKLHIVDSKVDGYLNLDNYDLSDATTVFMCGPIQMMTVLSKILKTKNLNAELIYKGFSFR